MSKNRNITKNHLKVSTEEVEYYIVYKLKVRKKNFVVFILVIKDQINLYQARFRDAISNVDLLGSGFCLI